jgi:hypothetical protein
MSDIKAFLNSDSTIKAVFSDGVTVVSGNAIPSTLLIGTRAGAYNVPITNYSMTVATRTGQVTIYIN